MKFQSPRALREMNSRRIERLQSKVVFHKARNKRLKNSMIASSKLRIVIDSSGVTEEATESLPGKGRTLDGIAEDKGKGVCRVEEIDISEHFSKKEKGLWDGDAGRESNIIITEFEALAVRNILMSEAKNSDSGNIDNIIFFYRIFCMAINHFYRYITRHSRKYEVEMTMIKQEECEELKFLEDLKKGLFEAEMIVEGEDQGPLTQSTPTAIFRRLQKGLSSLRELWGVMLIGSSRRESGFDSYTPLKEIEEINKILLFMDFPGILGDGDGTSTNENETKWPQSIDPRLYLKTDSNENNREKMFKGPSIARNTPKRIVKSQTGCACGKWCSGPSQT